MRFPVHHVDRFFLLFEGRPPPVACAWAFAVEGEAPGPERLLAAVGHALRVHPKASARLRKDGPWEWEVLDEAAPRAFVLEPPLDGVDEARAEDARLSLIMSAPLDPGEGPLVRVHWIPPGAHRGRLVLRFHHALTDGNGSLAFLRTLLEASDGSSSGGPAPAVAGAPAPLVAGGAGRKLGLLGRLLWLHARHSARHRLALPETLFAPSSRPTGALGVVGRRSTASRRDELIAAASAAGAGLPDLVLAACALAAERFLRERGRECGMLRLQVTQDLRRRRAGPPALENRSSAFPIWIGPRDRAAGKTLVGRVHRQMREGLRARAAEGTALFAAALRLPEPLARRLLLPAAVQPRIADSLIVSWLGALPSPERGGGWLRLGNARFAGVRAVVRPAEGVGALLCGAELEGRVELTLSYLEGLFERADAERYLALVDTSLDELAGVLRAG